MGGDWQLEYQTRPLATAGGFSIPAYRGLLDEIDGDDKANELVGTSEDDTLSGAAADDTLEGLGGNDTLVGGGDDDVYIFQNAWGVDTVTENADEGTDTLNFFQVTSDLAFTITDNNSVTVSDGAGNSTSAENVDLLVGGSGSSTLDYLSYGSGITVNLEKGEAEGDFEVQGIENVLGTSGSDSITGDHRNNRIVGGLGNDSLAGGLGDDTYVFADGWGRETVTEEEGYDSGQGYDTLDFSSVSRNLIFAVDVDEVLTVTDTQNNQVTAQNVEALIGGTGTNMLDFSSYSSGVIANLRMEFTTLFNSIIGFDSLIGSAYDDQLFGDDAVNFIDGGAGDDVIIGYGGADTLIGGDGTSDMLVEQKDADITLTDSLLDVGGVVQTISGFEAATLIGGAYANRLDASGFYTGRGNP